MIELKFEDKVKVWRDLREKIEVSKKPFEILEAFLSTLPVSSKKANAFDPNSQIQPWNLLEQSSFSEYEIAQICAYTLQLTDRFQDCKVEIHICKDIEKDRSMYLVILDGSIVLGYDKTITKVEHLPNSIVSQKIYVMPPLH